MMYKKEVVEMGFVQKGVVLKGSSVNGLAPYKIMVEKSQIFIYVRKEKLIRYVVHSCCESHQIASCVM